MKKFYTGFIERLSTFSFVEVLLAALALRFVAVDASVAASLCFISLLSLMGFREYLSFQRERKATIDVQKELNQLNDKINNVKNVQVLKSNNDKPSRFF